MEKDKLSELVNYFLQKGDLSHTADEVDEDGNEAFDHAAELFSVSSYDATSAWLVACDLKTLFEANLIDDPSSTQIEEVDLWELYQDIEEVPFDEDEFE